MGTIVPASEDWAPMRETFSYNRSWNSARCFLKPTVFMLAMLFEIVSTFSCWAAMPVAAILNARIYRSPQAALPSRWIAERESSWVELSIAPIRS